MEVRRNMKEVWKKYVYEEIWRYYEDNMKKLKKYEENMKIYEGIIKDIWKNMKEIWGKYENKNSPYTYIKQTESSKLRADIINNYYFYKHITWTEQSFSFQRGNDNISKTEK